MAVVRYGENRIGDLMKYQDYVIKDGRFVGKFEEMYQDFSDPWHQSEISHVKDSARVAVINWAERLSNDIAGLRVLELGCGYGHITHQLNERGIKSIGIDVSESAITKARVLHPHSQFEVSKFDNWSLLLDLNADIFILADITWYVLPSLTTFLAQLRTYAKSRSRPTFLFHTLTSYEPGEQQYGAEYFTNLSEMLSFFSLSYLETGEIRVISKSEKITTRNYFVAQVPTK